MVPTDALIMHNHEAPRRNPEPMVSRSANIRIKRYPFTSHPFQVVKGFSNVTRAGRGDRIWRIWDDERNRVAGIPVQRR
jgi:hypothetical protein